MDRARIMIAPGSNAPGSNETVALGAWIDQHGPLSPASAFLLALQVCARVSRVSHRQLGRAVQALRITHVYRGARGEWVWTPALDHASPSRVVTDTEIIERIGSLLWHSLTGQPVTDPYAGDDVLRTTMRALRPDVAAVLVDVVVRAVAARTRPPRTLSAVAGDIRQALGLEAAAPRRTWSRAPRLAASAAVALLAATAWTAGTTASDRMEAHGLTHRETELMDVIEETAQGLAVIDEHTAAIQEFQGIGERLRTRIAPEDPRIVWNWAHEAWVRHLAGDRLTTEQLLTGAPDWLARDLGDAHPYTRAARLALAAVLDGRGAAAEATALRTRADAATRQLLKQQVAAVLPGVPMAPGVVAHVFPNSPFPEGFRLDAGGRYFAPLTSVQRLNAEKFGWRLHIVARDTCDVAAVVGNQPRRVAAAVVRTAGGWEMRIDGVTPALVLHGAPADTAVVSISANSSGDVTASSATENASGRLGPASSTLAPPHALTFEQGGRADACSVVWLEIPIPFAPTGR